nr:hypothetical protein [Tanacetum cinerariifolium]
MDQQNPTLAKIPILDTGKFEQWQFRIQQYLQHEHYALWEVIEFRDSYEAPIDNSTTGSASDGNGKKKGRTITLTTDDMQKRKNNVKARTTLLLSFLDEHQLRFSKYKTAQELWAAILKTFGGNEATKKTKKNLLKQQYGNFKAEGSETLEQTFNRLQVIISQLQFMDIEIEQDDLNQKFLTSLAPEWLMHIIVWRNRSDLDTMSLDDLYNHLKVYESEVQKKSEPNSQNIAFISSAKHSSGNEEVNIASGSTASINVSTASVNIRDINQIDEDDMEEMDIKWNMALLSMRADRFWKKTRKKISIQGIYVARFDKSEVECFNCHKMGHFARECRAPRSQDRGRRDNNRQGSKVEEQAPKALMAIDGVGWDWSYMANDEENHALVADEEDPTEFALMAKTSAESEVFDNSLCSKACKKNTDSLNSNITDLEDKLGDAKNMIYHYKLGLAQVEARLAEHRNQELKYCEKIRILEFKTESRANCIESLTKDLELLKKEKGFQTASKDLDSLLESQRLDKNKEGLGYNVVPPPPAQVYSPPKKDINPSVTKTEASPSTISPKPFIKFVKANDSPTKSKTNKVETAKKPPVNKRVNKGTSRSQNNTHKRFTPRTVIHKPYRPPMRPMRPNMNAAQPSRTSFSKPAHSYTKRPFQRTSAVRSQYRGPRVPPVSRKFSTVNRKFPTANRKLPIGSTKFSTADMGKKGKVVKASTCNISYLSDYEPFDGGYVSFGQEGCKITSKGTIKTECIVLGRDFKLLDDANVLLRTPRQHNMYSINLNNIFPHKDLTCLVAKASADEGMLWHGRLDNLGKFEAKGDEGYFIGYSMSSKAFMVFNKRTKRVEENLHVDFLENKAIEKGAGPNWLFDIDSLTKSMNYVPVVVAGTNSTNFSGTKDATRQEVKKDVSSLRYIALPNWIHEVHLESSSCQPQETCNSDEPESSGKSNPTATSTNPSADQMETLTVETPIPTVSSPVSTACFIDSQEPSKPSSDTRLISKRVANQVETPSLDNILTLTNWFKDILGVTTNSKESNGVEADVSNMETTITASPTPTLRIHKDHPKSQIIGLWILQFKPGISPKRPKLVKAMQEELLQFKIQNVWTLIDCPKGVRPIGTKWVLKNKKDKRGIVIRNKSRLVAQGHTQEEGIDYDEVFAPVARIEAIRLLLAYASFMGFTDPEFPARVYKMEKAMYGLHQAPRIWYGTLSKYLMTNGFQKGTIDQTLFIRRQRGDFILVQVYVDDIIFGSSNPHLCREFEALMHEKFQMSAMGELNFFLGLQVLQKEDGIFLSQDKYVGDILKKFGYSDVRSANTPMNKENPWGKDGTGQDVDLNHYRSMIGSLMYLTASRPDIMFAVCACARHQVTHEECHLHAVKGEKMELDKMHQVTHEECHLHAVKMIFRYLKGHPKLGLWYPKESPFDLVAYSDSVYGGATQDRKSTTEGCQFLGRRLISWQCKKQTIVATSTTEAEYVATASGCGQVLWIQNQLLDYGDCFEKKLISVDHIHTDENVAYLLTKPFDAGRFKYLVSKHNVDFHPIVDFVEASPLRYALSFKPTVYVSHIRQFWSTARIETTNEGTKILATIDGNLRTVSESSIRRNLMLNDEAGISSLPDAELFENLTLMGYNISPNQKFTYQKGTPTEPHHTPSPEAQQTSPTTYSSQTLPPVTTAPIPTVTPYDTPHLRPYTRRARIAQSSALPPIADEPVSPLGDGSQWEACPTDSGLAADQDRANIAKTSTLPSDSTPRVTSLAADEGIMQQKLDELTALCTSLQRQHSKMVARRLDVGEEAAERVSDDTEEMASVLTSMDAATILSSGVADVPTNSGSIPTADPPATGVPTGSDVVPTAESETPKKKKIQEQMDIQMARQLEEEMEREAQMINEQIAKDVEIARIHAEEELQIMINGLDRSNETVAKYLQEYHQFATELPIERRIKLISDLVRYQDNYAKVHKYQSQQRKPLTKKQQREFYTSVLRNQAGWKANHFKGMTLEEIKEHFDQVWKQIYDFIPIDSKEEAERFKRKGIRFELESVKKLKTSEEVKATEEVPEEKLKEMMQLVPVEEVYVEALQVKHLIIDWKHLDREDLNQLWRLVKESFSIRLPTSDKEIELWVELKRLYEPDDEDQLWTHTQNLMHAPVEWKLYDTCGVHHVTSKDKEIFMLVEKDYPLRKGVAIVMICYKLQVENYSQMANDLIVKIYKIANCPSQKDD